MKGRGGPSGIEERTKPELQKHCAALCSAVVLGGLGQRMSGTSLISSSVYACE